MSKFMCNCGKVISDSGPGFSNQGYLIREATWPSVFEHPCERVAEFVGAIVAGEREKWIAEFYGRQDMSGMENSSVIYDIMTQGTPQTVLDVFQCEFCNRLWVERSPGVRNLAPFAPESHSCHRWLAEP